MHLPPELQCEAHDQPLTTSNGAKIENSDTLICSQGCRFPIVGGIPRFVSAENYATAFGLQWNAFRKTQLDSYTDTTISQDRLTRCLGGSLDIVKGKSVLEAGCGAGRFTEVLLGAGARVFACDLSEAVEANYENCKRWPDYFVCQADIGQLPTMPQAFDIVLCLGVIQHTRDPEATITTLAGHVKPGGMLVIDHYSRTYPYTLPRRLLRPLLIRLPPLLSKKVALGLARSLLPVHKIFWSRRRGIGRLRAYLGRVSPLVDYYGAYPELDNKLLGEWAILDTHDMLTDHYKHFRSVEEIKKCLTSCGLVEIEVREGGNGIEARAFRAGAEA